jgi:dTDP-4-dehydrorhamnose 3,5-epimerase
MKVTSTRIPEVRVIEPRVFRDERGFFFESWNRARYAELGIGPDFVQDNLSHSTRGVLRGLHFQNPSPQGKLVSVVEGAVWDVAVDVRRGSATFGQWVGVELTSENHRQLYVPEGFAHGFVVTSDVALFTYKCTRAYSPADERSVRWDDPDLDIRWPVADTMVSAKDAAAPLLRDVPEEFLFAMAGSGS